VVSAGAAVTRDLHRSLVDNETGGHLGEATAEQIAASDRAPGGLILIDDDGRVVRSGSWDASQAGVRTVWVD